MATQEDIIEGNRRITEFMEQQPKYEWCVGNKNRDAYCYSPEQTGYYPTPQLQKQECERWCRDNKEYCEREGYEPVMFTWYPFYNSHWELLMPVVEKIEKLGYDSRIIGHNSDGGFLCDFVDNDNNEIACVSNYNVPKISVVWASVIQFIQRYNQNKKP